MTGDKTPYYLQVKQLAVLTTIPILLLAGPAVGYFFGAWLDRKFQCYPWCTLIVVGLGFVASGREVVRILNNILKSDK